MAVKELRLVVTADDYEEAVAFYRDVLGLPQRASYSSENGRVVILEVERATLEIADPGQAEYIDEVEVGRRGRHGDRRADPDTVELAQRPARNARRDPAHPIHRTRVASAGAEVSGLHDWVREHADGRAGACCLGSHAGRRDPGDGLPGVAGRA